MGRKVPVKVMLVLVSLMVLASGWQPAKAEVGAVDLAFPIKIMPFGDSITTSVGDHFNSFSPQASYRYWLDHLLHSAKIDFVFKGTQTLNYDQGEPKYPDFDHHHEGHSGYAVYNFLDSGDPNYIDNLLTADNIPDMVLIHMGTNDLIQNIQIEYIDTVISNLGILIDHFRAKNPNIIILLAQIIPCKGYDGCFNVDDLNAKIPNLANLKTNENSPVVVVDLYTGFDATVGVDTGDGIHPIESGEKKMANAWMKKIQIYWNYHLQKVFIPSILN